MQNLWSLSTMLMEKAIHPSESDWDMPPSESDWDVGVKDMTILYEILLCSVSTCKYASFPFHSQCQYESLLYLLH